MKVILSCILILTVCHQALSTLTPSSVGSCGRVNNYFQAPTQTFHMCNGGVSKEEQVPAIPDDYHIYPGVGAYKFHFSALTWNDARHLCLKEGAHLPVIMSAEEDDILRKKQKSIGAEYLWLGVHEQYQKDDWVTVFDQQLSKLDYVHWLTGEPNNINNDEHCACSTVDGMNDIRCDKKLWFFCKIDLK